MGVRFKVLSVVALSIVLSAPVYAQQDIQKDQVASPMPERQAVPKNKKIDEKLWISGFLKNSLGGKKEISLLSDQRNDPETLQTLRLDDAVAFALENNNELKGVIEEGKSAYWDKMGAYSQYLPAVSLDLAIGRERSRPASYNDSNGDRKADDRHLRRDRALLVKQPIFDLIILSDILNTSKKEEMVQLKLLETRNKTTADTVKAYLQLLQSKISMQLAESYLKHLNELSSIMQSRVDAGGGVSADLDRIISRASIAENAIVEAQAEYDIGISEFKRLTGIVPASLVLPTELVPDVPVDVDMALREAYQNNPNFLVSLKKIDLAKNDRNKAAAGLVPKVYAQLSGDYTYNAGGAANGNPVDGVYPSQRTDKAMIVAQWNLYGGTSVASALSGMAKQREMSFLAQDVQDKIDQAMQVNYTAVRAASDRIAVLRKSVEANERAVKGFKEQFKAGTRSLFELLDAYEQSYNAQLNLTRAVFSNAQAAYQILQQTGSIVDVVATQEPKEQ